MNPDQIVTRFNISPGMRIADFGAGSGYFTILMAQLAGESGLVTAVDVLEPALETIRTKAKTSGLKNIQTLRANLEVSGSTGIATQSQDLVLLANVLFQSEKKVEIIQEAGRVLKVGGQLVVIDWKKDNGGVGPPEQLRITPAALTEIVTNCGFVPAEPLEAGQFHFGLTFKKG